MNLGGYLNVTKPVIISYLAALQTFHLQLQFNSHSTTFNFSNHSLEYGILVDCLILIREQARDTKLPISQHCYKNPTHALQAAGHKTTDTPNKDHSPKLSKP
jgi:hypothetical protein